MKKIVLVVSGVLLIVIISMLLLPSSAHVERSIEIHASSETIFSQVNNFRNWERWSPWHNIDPEMEVIFEGEEGKNSVYKWKSNNSNVGSGMQKIIISLPYKFIKTELEFEGQGTAYATFEFIENIEGITKVKWAFDTDFGWNLAGRVMGLFFDKMIGSDYEKGLSKLKEITEIIPEKAELDVKEEEITNTIWYLSATDSISSVGADSLKNALFSQIRAFLQEKGIREVSAPLAFYHHWSKEKVVVEAGIPIKDSIPSSGKIKIQKISPCKVIHLTHYGNYENLRATHLLFKNWIDENSITVIGNPWEVYLTNPQHEKEVSKWQTQVFYRVK